jgi:HEAT repeat protein
LHRRSSLNLPALILLAAFAAAAAPHAQEPARTQATSADEAARLQAKLRSSDEEERYHAAVMLSALGPLENSAALRIALDDESERVRAVAVTALGNTGERSFAPALVARLAEDKSPFVRKAAAYALGRLKTREGTLALAAALANKEKKHEEVRGAAVTALGEYSDEAAIPALTAALADKADHIRAGAASALGTNRGAARAAVPKLINLLTSDPENAVRRQAAIALGRIGDPAAIPALELAQHDRDPYLSRAALEAIKQITAARGSR